MENKFRTSDFILASLLTSYPDEMFSDDLHVLLAETAGMVPEQLRSRVLEIAGNEGRIDDLRSEYLALFDSGRGVAPLYETEYGRQRALFKANELSAISGFYHAFGFELGGEGAAREMPDHISVELEFYALLLMKQAHLMELADTQGVETVESARRKFLRDHLGRFVSSILLRPGVEESETYGEILHFVESLVREECASLGVIPEQASWIEGEQENSEITCGGTVGCIK